MKCLHNHQRAAKVLTIALMMTVLTQAQNPTTVERRNSGFYPFFGIGVDFFVKAPDIADGLYALSYTKSESNDYDMSFSSPPAGVVGDFNSCFIIELGVAYRKNIFDVTGSCEWSGGSIGSGDYSYHYTRFAPNLGGNFYIPLGSLGKHAMSLGAAINYNYIKAYNYLASFGGYKLQYGFCFQYGKFNLQPYLNYNSCKVTEPFRGHNLDLNFSSIQIGVLLSLHPIIYFKD